MSQTIGKIVAVVVTFNRIKFLPLVINSLKNQTYKIDEIIVVDNSSTDGTNEWLKSHPNITTITQANLGGSGGFNTGVQIAIDKQADWVWLLDDDICPDLDCLRNLLNYSSISECIQPIHYYSDGTMQDEEYWVNPADCSISSNFNLSFKSGKKSWFRNTGSFEGMLIRANIIKKIGYPDPRFFFYYDDLIYGFQANKYTNVIVIADAIVRKLPVIRNTASQYNLLYYSHRNLWILSEYFSNDISCLNEYRQRRLLLKFITTLYQILKSSKYNSRRKAISTLYKAYKDYRKRKHGSLNG